MNTSIKHNQEKSKIINAVVITSDPQYPWTTQMDFGKDDRDEKIKREESEELIKSQYRDVDSYILNNKAAPVIINGDITAFGHTWQRNKMNKIFNEELHVHYFYGLGNHDIENNFNDCFQNECTGGSLSTYVNHVQKIHDKFLDDMDIKISGTDTTKYYEGCFAYSIILGDIYSIQLNNYPTMELNFRSGINRHFKMKSTLDWLEKVLKKASSLGKIIIVNVHKPNGWKSERFTKLINDYKVTAIFAGHYHTVLGLQTNYTENFGNIPVFLSGSASQRSYLIVEQTEENLNVYSVRENNWKERKLEKSIKLNLPMKGKYKIKTALNNTSGVDVSSAGDKNIHLYQDNAITRSHWKFQYNKNKDAYQIINVWFKDEVMAWNDYNGSKNVFVTKNQYKDEHYWRLEEVGNGYYIIKNYKDPNLVLDVQDGKTSNHTNIQVYQRNGTNAQKFKLVTIIH